MSVHKRSFLECVGPACAFFDSLYWKAQKRRQGLRTPKNYVKFFIFITLFCYSCVAAETSTQRSALLASLEPTSLRQHLAFYQLYRETPEAAEALRRGWTLLCSSQKNKNDGPCSLSYNGIQQIVSLLGDSSLNAFTPIPEQDIRLINTLASHLPNRKLRGYLIEEEDQLVDLPPEDIDISQAVLLSQGIKANPQRMASYKASLDLMALQILARVGLEASPIEKINAINTFIFDELGYRFPPHSLYAKEIDRYTFLSSIIDQREGVCLGVTILYLSLAQRVGLPLEIITPPGHIYVRYWTPTYHINIETTARGVHLDDKTYLGVNTRTLSKRSLKEVVGMIHYNQASVYWMRKEYDKVEECYKKAYPYLTYDLRLQELMAFNALMLGRKEEGFQLLRALEQKVEDDEVARDPFAQDILDFALDQDSIAAVMMAVDETRSSILKKKAALEESLKKFPNVRSLHFHLAATLMQLNREREGLQELKIYHHLDPNNPTVEYYLAVLSAQRKNYPDAWFHLRRAEMIAGIRGYQPHVLKELRRELSILYPKSNN